MLSERENVVSELLLGHGAEGGAIDRPQGATLTSASLLHLAGEPVKTGALSSDIKKSSWMPFSVPCVCPAGAAHQKALGHPDGGGLPSQNAGRGALVARVPCKLLFCSFLSLA